MRKWERLNLYDVDIAAWIWFVLLTNDDSFIDIYVDRHTDRNLQIYNCDNLTPKTGSYFGELVVVG